MKTALQIDIDKVLQEKSPKLKFWIPKFIVTWFKNFIHQDEMNKVLREGKDLNGVDFAQFVIDEMGAKITYVGLENIPKTGGCIVASNHPLGGLDGMALMVGASKVREDFKFLANDILMHIEPLKEHFIAVNKLSKNSKNNLSLISNEYKSNKAILVFPAGLCSRKTDGKIMDLPWQKSVISKSIEHQLPIVPTYIDGENSKMFYNVADFRKFLSLKFNIEMLLLPNELYKQKGKAITVYFGKPIDYTKFSKTKALADAQQLKHFVYQIKNNLALEFVSNS
jgi:1-acyl-sn-glycerol-3-phosphate acyltransferase